MFAHTKYRVWLYDLKLMVGVTEMDFKNHVLHFIAPEDPEIDHPASELMESTNLTAITAPSSPRELWEGDIVRISSLLGYNYYNVEWYFQRWILRHRAKHTIKEIVQKDLQNYYIVGHIYMKVFGE